MVYCSKTEACKDIGIGAEFSIVLEPCVDGGCTSNGECREHFSGVFYFSSCYCYAGKWLKTFLFCSLLFAGLWIVNRSRNVLVNLYSQFSRLQRIWLY